MIETDFATATISINGTKSSPLTMPAVARNGYELFVGADFDKGTAGSASLRVDNVVCDVTP